MQSEDKNVRIPISSSRYKQYMYLKYNLAKRCSREILPIGQNAGQVAQKHSKEVGEAFLIDKDHDVKYDQASLKVNPKKVAGCLRARDYMGPCKDFTVICEKPNILNNENPSQAAKIYGHDGPGPSLCAGTHGYALGYISEPIKVQEITDNERQGYKVYNAEEGFSPTLQKCARHALIVDKDEATQVPVSIDKDFSNNDSHISKVDPITGNCVIVQSPSITRNSTNMVAVKEIGLAELTSEVSQAYRVFDPEQGVSTCVLALGGGLGAKSGLYAVEDKEICTVELTPRYNDKGKRTSQMKRVLDPGGVSRCIDTWNSFLYVEKGEVEQKITLQDVVNGKYRIRKLTPEETQMLQGFPVDWNEVGLYENKKGEMELRQVSDSARYKMSGNAVSTWVIANMMYNIVLDVGESLWK